MIKIVKLDPCLAVHEHHRDSLLLVVMAGLALLVHHCLQRMIAPRMTNLSRTSHYSICHRHSPQSPCAPYLACTSMAQNCARGLSQIFRVLSLDRSSHALSVCLSR